MRNALPCTRCRGDWQAWRVPERRRGDGQRRRSMHILGGRRVEHSCWVARVQYRIGAGQLVLWLPGCRYAPPDQHPHHALRPSERA